MKLYDKLKPKLVLAENIAQTAQFVESGNAQLGLISLTTASARSTSGRLGRLCACRRDAIRRFGSARW